MMRVDSSESIEPLHATILELGRRYAAGEITRERRDDRLVGLNQPQPTLRRKRARSLRLTIPAPVTFLSIEQITLPQEQL